MPEPTRKGGPARRRPQPAAESRARQLHKRAARRAQEDRREQPPWGIDPAELRERVRLAHCERERVENTDWAPVLVGLRQLTPENRELVVAAFSSSAARSRVRELIGRVEFEERLAAGEELTTSDYLAIAMRVEWRQALQNRITSADAARDEWRAKCAALEAELREFSELGAERDDIRTERELLRAERESWREERESWNQERAEMAENCAAILDENNALRLMIRGER